MDKLTRARYYAEIAHAGQTYNNEIPYTLHLEAVVNVLKRFGVHDENILCAGWLHDVIEDTRVSYNDIKDRFDVHVAELVYSVTNERGRNRKERNEKTYPKINGVYNPTVLKLADRIANVEYGMASGGKAGMYAGEFLNFMEGIYYPFDEDDDKLSLASPDQTDRMWRYLAQLLNHLPAFEKYSEQMKRHYNSAAEKSA